MLTLETLTTNVDDVSQNSSLLDISTATTTTTTTIATKIKIVTKTATKTEIVTTNMTMTHSSNTIRRPRPRSWPQTWTRRVVVIPLIVVLLTLRMMTIIRMLAKIILTIWVIWRRYIIGYINNKHKSLVPLFFSSSSTLTFNLFFKI